MSNQLTRAVISVVVVVLGIVGVVALSNRDSGADKKSDSAATQTDKNKKENKSKEKSDKTAKPDYEYVAQSGDSYTLFARKAVQQYTEANDVKLTNAQIVYAETVLTQAAGSPELNLGESRAFDKVDLKKVVADAQELSQTQQAAWAVYAQHADFDTTGVGVES